VDIAMPSRVKLVKVQTACEMLAACEATLPADVAVFTAAVSDWRPDKIFNSKLKKRDSGSVPEIHLAANPDILATIAHGANRPALVVGFAAETENVVAHAQAKRASKGCDWIVANDVSPGTGIMGGDTNTVHLVTATGVEDWPQMSKMDVGRKLAARIAAALGKAA
jgi:phosphopantothenoylcysteine decarboxylase/phosphopantothenate--cysteine ligase